MCVFCVLGGGLVIGVGWWVDGIMVEVEVSGRCKVETMLSWIKGKMSVVD